MSGGLAILASDVCEATDIGGVYVGIDVGANRLHCVAINEDRRLAGSWLFDPSELDGSLARLLMRRKDLPAGPAMSARASRWRIEAIWEKLAESDRPGCGGASLEVRGEVDPTDVGQQVSLLGEVDDGVLTISSTSLS